MSIRSFLGINSVCFSRDPGRAAELFFIHVPSASSKPKLQFAPLNAYYSGTLSVSDPRSVVLSASIKSDVSHPVKSIEANIKKLTVRIIVFLIFSFLS